MPIFEFYSPDNNKLYQFLARHPSHSQQIPRCPDGDGLRMEKRLSRFAIIGKAKEDAADDPFASLNDQQMASLMADLERDMPDIDDPQADPRQMGHFMSKLTDAMGSKAPPELREIAKRLASGENPDRLESEFGHLMGDGTSGENLLSQVIQKLRSQPHEPQRDPKLYEMSDYL